MAISTKKESDTWILLQSFFFQFGQNPTGDQITISISDKELNKHQFLKLDTPKFRNRRFPRSTVLIQLAQLNSLSKTQSSLVMKVDQGSYC